MKIGKSDGDPKVETSQHGFEEYLSVPSSSKYTPNRVMDQCFFSSILSCEPLYENLDFSTSNASLSELVASSQVRFPSFAFPCNDICPFINGYPVTESVIDSPFLIKKDEPPLPVLQDHEPVEDGQVCEFLFDDPEEMNNSNLPKDEKDQAFIENVQSFHVGSTEQNRKGKALKIEGQPSKNLMAERRRRKRLNDRLSMLRSIVPKISKTDRTSTVGDAIDYVRELQEKIYKLKGELETNEDNNQMNLEGTLNGNTNKVTVKSPSKFDVERRDNSTQIEISCATKPGLLFSTVNTIEALGLDIQQCVISCVYNFSLQASCSEMADHRKFTGCEDIKQELCRNAGYGERCV